MKHMYTTDTKSLQYFQVFLFTYGPNYGTLVYSSV